MMAYGTKKSQSTGGCEMPYLPGELGGEDENMLKNAVEEAE